MRTQANRRPFCLSNIRKAESNKITNRTNGPYSLNTLAKGSTVSMFRIVVGDTLSIQAGGLAGCFNGQWFGRSVSECNFHAPE
jgi:hypothetical protein